MWSWRKKSVECFGGVLFAGGLPPRPHELAHLERLGVTPTSRDMRPLRLTRANRDKVLEYLAPQKQDKSAKD